MVTDTAELVPLSRRVGHRADRERESTLLMDILAAPFYVTGWLVFWMLVVLGGGARWCWAAVELGWVEARASATSRNVGLRRWPVKPKAKRREPGQPGRQ